MFLDNELIKNLELKRNMIIKNHPNFSKRFLFKITKKYRRIEKRNETDIDHTMIAGITITEKCNLNCIYCYQKFKTSKSLPRHLAEQIITRILTANNIWTNIEFRILGGEPFIESQLLYDIIDWTLQQHWKKRYYFKIATNGTLLQNDQKKWISKNKKKICLNLSFDGPSDIQNKSRSNSFGKIDLNFFKDNWPEQSVKMTISKCSINKLHDSVVQVMNMGFNVSFSLAGGEKWDEKDLSIFIRELSKIESLFSNFSTKVPPIYDIKFSRLLNSNDSTRQCGIGKNIVVYDTEGKPYSCHLLLPNVLDMNYLDVPPIEFFSDDNVLKDEFCTECIIKNICPTCYGLNFVERGKCNERDHHLCSFNKEIIKNAAIIKAKRIVDIRIIDFEKNII